MQNIFFFQPKQIPDSSSIFNQFKEQKIFFSYFQVDPNYYLFVYSQNSIDIHFLYQSVEIIEELDSKQRKIRSLRGFFLYALEIIENAQDYEILSTNLQPFFWKKVKNIIRQNKKAALQKFLFIEYTDKQNDNKGSNPKIQLLENQIQNLQNQVNSLQQKVIQLEAKFFTAQQNSKDLLSEPSHPLKSSKTIQHDDYTLKTNNEAFQPPFAKHGSYSQENNQGDKLDSNTFSETSKIEFKKSKRISTSSKRNNLIEEVLRRHRYI